LFSINEKKDVDFKGGIYIACYPDKITKDRIKYFVKEKLKLKTSHDDYHMTLIYSSKECKETIKIVSSDKIVASPKEYDLFPNSTDKTGKSFALVLKLESKTAKKLHDYLMKNYKLKYDYDEYIPHLTLTYDIDAADDDFKNKLESKEIPLPDFNLVFDKVKIEEINEKYIEEKTKEKK